jgi:hypothetical protein
MAVVMIFVLDSSVYMTLFRDFTGPTLSLYRSRRFVKGGLDFLAYEDVLGVCVDLGYTLAAHRGAGHAD